MENENKVSDMSECEWCLDDGYPCYYEVCLCIDCLTRAKGRIAAGPRPPMTWFGRLLILLWSLFLMGGAAFWTMHETGILERIIENL